RPDAVGRTLAALSPAFGALLAPPAAAAALEGVWLLAAALAGPLAAFAALWVASRRAAPPSDLRLSEALIVAAAAFALAALAAAPAFRALGMPPAAALFEAVSGITTTGLSLARDPDAWPVSAHFLRAWLQWCGGLAFLASALALLIGPGALARRLGAEAGLGGTQTLPASTRTRARALLKLYASLTVLFAAAAAAVASDPIDGVLLALSGISAGGFAPDSTSLVDESRLAQAVVMSSCLVGALSFPLLISVRRTGLEAIPRDPALRLWLGLTLLTFVALVGFEALRSGAADPARIAHSAVTAVSAITTAGYASESMAALPAASLAALLLAMVVGGDVGSTAGGLKATRAVVALAALRLTAAHAANPPGAVTHLRALGQRIRGGELAALAGLAAVYALTAGLLWIGLLALGAEALPALFDVVSALSTVGLSTGVVGPDLPDWMLLALSLAMLMGRLEFFAVLALFNPRMWTWPKGTAR
ncbi:MAG: potassium transporter TrkG, partial [Pseudomonadota bacterium]